VVQLETVETVEASPSPVLVISGTRRRLFQQSAGTLAEEKGTVSEGQEPVEQDDFPTDNASYDDSEVGDYDTIPREKLAMPWEMFWGEMEGVCGWTKRAGGQPYRYVKPGHISRPGESKVGVDYFDEEADVQAYARQHYGWRGNDTDDDDVYNEDDDDDDDGYDEEDEEDKDDMEGSASAGAKTPINQNTECMAVTPSPSKVRVVCPLCDKLVTTYTWQSRDPLPLTRHGIADWEQDWPLPELKNVVQEARKHFKQQHEKVIMVPASITYKNTVQNIKKNQDGSTNYCQYKRNKREQKKAKDD
jgi:hypothetical protein